MYYHYWEEEEENYVDSTKANNRQAAIELLNKIKEKQAQQKARYEKTKIDGMEVWVRVVITDKEKLLAKDGRAAGN